MYILKNKLGMKREITFFFNIFFQNNEVNAKSFFYIKKRNSNFYSQ